MLLVRPQSTQQQSQTTSQIRETLSRLKCCDKKLISDRNNKPQFQCKACKKTYPPNTDLYRCPLHYRGLWGDLKICWTCYEHNPGYQKPYTSTEWWKMHDFTMRTCYGCLGYLRYSQNGGQKNKACKICKSIDKGGFNKVWVQECENCKVYICNQCREKKHY